jgi:hypothetical protein
MERGVCVAEKESIRHACKLCGSVVQKKFSAEMGIHFPELENIDNPVVWVFPEVVVCLDCGTAEFAVPEAELRELAKRDVEEALRLLREDRRNPWPD